MNDAIPANRTTLNTRTQIRRKPAFAAPSSSMRAPAGVIQRAGASVRSPRHSEIPPIVHAVLRSPGQPLDAASRAFMEPRFGHEFGHVRVHTGEKAARSARNLDALAYTVGHDVVFASGQYSPHSSAGRRLLAHELTHVLQQDAYSQNLVGVRWADAACERNADRASDCVLGGFRPKDLLPKKRVPRRRGCGQSRALALQRKGQRGEGEPRKLENDRLSSLIPSVEGRWVLHNEFPMRDYGWLAVGLGVAVELKGKAHTGDKLGVSLSNEGEVEISRSLNTELGEIELKVEGKPGEATKLAFEFGGKTLGVEASANADWERPITFAGKYKFPAGEATFLGTKYDGEVEVSFEMNIRPGRQMIVTAVRTVAGAAAQAVGTTAFAVIGTSVAFAAWVGGGVYAMGRANYLGAEEAIGMFFARGYAEMLAALSEPLVSNIDHSLLNVQWQGLLNEARHAYHEPGSQAQNAGLASGYLATAGRAKALQSVAKRLPSERERSGWALAERVALGEDRKVREALYLARLKSQRSRGVAPEDLLIEG